jgi:hypothetical protein
MAVEQVRQREELAAGVRADPGSEGLAPVQQLVAETDGKAGGIQLLVFRSFDPPAHGGLLEKVVLRVANFGWDRTNCMITEPR